MFFKKISCVILFVVIAYGDAASLKSKGYVLDNLKQLDNLIQRKKSVKTELSLDVLFDEYVDDAKQLLEELKRQNYCEQLDTKSIDTVKQIAHYMAILQKLLAIIDTNQHEPLKNYCHYQRSDALWGTLCGDRPSKRVPRSEEQLRKIESETSQPSKVRYVDNDEDIQTEIGSH